MKDEPAHLNELKNLISEGKKSGKVVAIGEFGLGTWRCDSHCNTYISQDYDRLQFCPREIQQEYEFRKNVHLKVS